MELMRENIEPVSWQRLPEQGHIWVYVPVRPGGMPGEGLPEADAAFAILESYIDVVVEGGLEYGVDYARELIETTADWSQFWLNDRELACAVKRRRFPVGARPTRRFAPAGSNRSSHGGNEMAEAFD